MPTKETQNFDLNIEKILEGWGEVKHAIRELIANALDEQVLSDTHDVTISADRSGTSIMAQSRIAFDLAVLKQIATRRHSEKLKILSTCHFNIYSFWWICELLNITQLTITAPCR
jgi:hypothetical protein